MLFLISAIGTGFAPDVWTVVLFRIVGGIGVGVASVIAPAYIAETSPPRIRGRLGSLQQLAHRVRHLPVVRRSTGCCSRRPAARTRRCGSGSTPGAGCSSRWQSPPSLYGVLAFTIPESPRYLVASHKIPEARRVLNMLLGEKNLEITIDRIQETLEREDKPSLRDLKKPTGGIYGIVWVGLGLSIFQQFVGINVIFYYSNVLWQAVGFSADESARLHRDHVGDQRADHVDRHRPDRQDRTQAAAAHRLVGMAVTLITMSVIFANADAPTPTATPTPARRHRASIALIAANLFVVAFGMSWGPVVWVLLGEMFPNRIRAAALGLAAAGQWAANWLITVTFPGLREHLGPRVRLLRAVRGAVGPVRVAVGDGDQGRVPGGHARRDPAPQTDRRRPDT